MKNAQAGLEGDLDQATKDHKGATGDLLALGEYIAQLHGSCDFLLENFDVRREARSGEIDAIKKAKAVLSGADYSFVQVNRRGPEEKAIILVREWFLYLVHIDLALHDIS